jgi:hypothetical protein
LQYIKGQEEESVSNFEGVILPQVRFMECPIKTSLGVLGKKRTIMTIRDIGFRKIVRFNLAPTIYSRPYAEGPFNASEATREGRVHRMRRGKEIADEGAEETYWEG